MQIKKRAIENNAVDGNKIRLSNNEALKARNFANSADVGILKLNTSDLAEFVVKPQSSFTPSANNDLATVAWVKSYADGMRDLKDAVRACSLTNITLATMPSSVDGVTLSSGERFAVVRQTAGAENGIYIFNGAGASATRASDADSDAEVTQGMSFDVAEGLVNAKRRFLLTTASVTLGTTALTFVAVPTGSEIKQSKLEGFTLSAGDISNQYVALANKAIDASVQVFYSGVLQTQGVDYTLSTISNVTRITFAGDLASAGNIALVATDVLTVRYEHEVLI
jgi:hypothetical protein